MRRGLRAVSDSQSGGLGDGVSGAAEGEGGLLRAVSGEVSNLLSGGDSRSGGNTIALVVRARLDGDSGGVNHGRSSPGRDGGRGRGGSSRGNTGKKSKAEHRIKECKG